MRFRNTSVALLAALAVGSPLAGQSASEIINTMTERHAERMTAVQNYTTTQMAAGQETVTYFERTGDSDGIPVFEPKLMIAAGMRMDLSGEDGGNDLTGMFSRMRAAAERATVQGTESIDGSSAWVIQFANVADLGWSAPGGQDTFTPDTFTLYLDQARYVPLRMRFVGNTEVDGAMKEMTADITMGDYREVQGMLHPFKMSIATAGLVGGDGMDPEEIQAQIAEARAQIASVPEAQRAMVAGMMEEAIKTMEAMLAGEPIELTTIDLKVNAGPPGGF